MEAAAAIDRGETVVVSAPTGSGKTVVAEAAIARARERGERVLYTTPLKALSNQKYGDLRAQHGAAAVGLLTGDNSINGRAPVVVMTTEVLRNMMYAGSPDLADVGTVVLDEVHYLQDRARGPVWEEIIIHLDRGDQTGLPLRHRGQRRRVRLLGAGPARAHDPGGGAGAPGPALVGVPAP